MRLNTDANRVIELSLALERVGLVAGALDKSKSVATTALLAEQQATWASPLETLICNGIRGENRFNFRT